jgi:hypothetical protein
MKIAINKNIVDKATQAVLVKHTGTFQNVDISAAELAQSVQSGYAFCAQHKGGWRQQSNFVEAGFLAVDIDHGLTVQNALDDEFVKQYASILYTTPSHSEDFPRFRLVFELEVSITDAVKMRNALTGLIMRLGGDTACKDACHMFFGSTTSTPNVIGKILPEQQVDELVARTKETRLAVASMAGDQKRSNTRSIVVLPKDTEVKTESGVRFKLSEIPESERIFCPRHSDNKPSAVTLRSKQGNPGLYCSKCVTTYFLDNGKGGSGRDDIQYNFDYSWDCVLKLTVDEFERYDTEDGMPSLNEIRGGTITPLSERYLPYVNPDISREGKYSITDSDGNLLDRRVVNPDAGRLNIPYHITLIKSPKGTGKTEWLRSLVKEYKSQNASILLIGHRRALISASAKRLGLTCYLQESGDDELVKSEYNAATNHYAVCVDSLTTRLNTMTHQYDLILIDEAEQVFSHLLAETMNENRREILHTFKHFINKAKSIYLLDADLGRTSIEIIDTLLDDAGEYQAIVNTWTPPNKTVQLYKGKNHLVGELFASLRRGERCFVCSNSKAKIDELYSEIGEQFGDAKRLLAVTSDNAHLPEIQNVINNIKTRVLDYDAIFVSPALGTGIDITFDNDGQLIDSVFGIFEARINTHFDIDQQLARVRNPKQTHVYISAQEFNFEADDNAIRAELIASDAEHRLFLSINPDGSKKYNQDVLYETIFASITAMQRASKNRLLKNFRDLKRHNGWTVVDVENNDLLAREGKKAIDAGKERLAKKTEEGILGAEMIGPEMYDAYQRKVDSGKITPEEKLAMRRYELESFYCEDVTQALLKQHDDGRFRKCVRKFEMLYLSREDLRSRELRDEYKLAGDRQNPAQQQKLLVSLFSVAGLMDADKQFDVSKELEIVDLAGFTKECIRKKLQIERLLDIPVRKDVRENPIQQLNALLRLVGLSLGKQKAKSSGGNKRYIYTLDGDKLALVQTIADRRADQSVREAWKTMLQDRDVDQEWLAGHPKPTYAKGAIDPMIKVAKAPTAKEKLLASMSDVDANISG